MLFLFIIIIRKVKYNTIQSFAKMKSRILCLPLAVQDIIWEYEGRYKAFITKKLIKDAARNFRYRCQELNMSDSDYMQIIDNYYGRNGISDDMNFTNWHKLPLFDKVIPKIDDVTLRNVYHYQILFYPKEDKYRRFIILPADIDSSKISTNDPIYTGWFCTERQQTNILDKYNPGWDGGGEIFMDEFESISYVDFITDNRKIFCMGHNDEKNLSLYVDDFQ